MNQTLSASWKIRFDEFSNSTFSSYIPNKNKKKQTKKNKQKTK